MSDALIEVGVREFREGLARYLESETPLAITRHGQTVGYYIPARPSRDERQVEALMRAVGRFESMLADLGVTEDEIVREFSARRARR